MVRETGCITSGRDRVANVVDGASTVSYLPRSGLLRCCVIALHRPGSVLGVQEAPDDLDVSKTYMISSCVKIVQSYNMFLSSFWAFT